MKVTILLLLMLSIGSCSENPYPSVDEDQMVVIMSDMAMADNIIRLYPTSMRDSIRIELMESLLKIHNLTKTELDTNLYLYSVDVDRYEGMVKKMIIRYDSLSANINTTPPING